MILYFVKSLAANNIEFTNVRRTKEKENIMMCCLFSESDGIHLDMCVQRIFSRGEYNSEASTMFIPLEPVY